MKHLFLIEEVKPTYTIEKIKENEFILTVDLSGCEEEDIEISKFGNKLIIKGYLDNFIYSRTFNFNFPIKIKDIKFNNGILTIRFSY